MHWKALRNAAVAATTVAAAFALSASPASAAPPGTIRVQPGQSIQAAVDAAKPGATVLVAPGVYEESVTIQKNDLTLSAYGATLVPGDEIIDTVTAAAATSTPCDQGPPPEEATVADAEAPASGICIGASENTVKKVTVKGITVDGFSANGIIAFNASDTTISDVTTLDNEEYGVAAFESTKTRVTGRRAEGSEEAGFYFGDSPKANIEFSDNEAAHNGFGVFLRASQHGTVKNSNIHDNCVGILVLGGAPDPAGDYDVSSNAIVNNNETCPPNDEQPFPVGGVGVALLGSHDMNVHSNTISQNGPAVEGSPFGGGLVLGAFDPAFEPTGNVVKSNDFFSNDPDIVYDGSGSKNTFKNNNCTTSDPADICGTPI